MILVSITISDWDQYWSVFSTKGQELRNQHGSNGVRVFRETDDPENVWLLLDWDREQFEQFVATSEARAAMREGGLKGPPEPRFVELAGELAH